MRILAAEIVPGVDRSREEEAALIVLGALLLALLHLFVRPLRRRLMHSDVVGDSAIAGLSTAYVFVVLLPELEPGHDIVGDYIFLIVLAGFITLYGLEQRAHRRAARWGSGTEDVQVFWLLAGVQWCTGFLFVVTWPNVLHERPTFFLLTVVGPALGLALHGYQLSERDPALHGRWGRWALASGPLVGAAFDSIWHETDEAVLDLLVAFLAGLVLFAAIAKETYEHERTRFLPFMAGVSAYVAIFLTRPLHPG